MVLPWKREPPEIERNWKGRNLRGMCILCHGSWDGRPIDVHTNVPFCPPVRFWFELFLAASISCIHPLTSSSAPLSAPQFSSPLCLRPRCCLGGVPRLCLLFPRFPSPLSPVHLTVTEEQDKILTKYVKTIASTCPLPHAIFVSPGG